MKWQLYNTPAILKEIIRKAPDGSVAEQDQAALIENGLIEFSSWLKRKINSEDIDKYNIGDTVSFNINGDEEVDDILTFCFLCKSLISKNSKDDENVEISETDEKFAELMVEQYKKLNDKIQFETFQFVMWKKPDVATGKIKTIAFTIDDFTRPRSTDIIKVVNMKVVDIKEYDE